MKDILLYVYKDFVPIGVVENFKVLKWIRRYNDASEFSIEVEFNPVMDKMFQVGNIIYKKDIGETCIVEDIELVKENNNTSVIKAKGRGLSSFLNRRVVTYLGSGNLISIINSIVNSNYINSSNVNRKISNLVNRNMLVTSKTYYASFENENGLEVIKELCMVNNLGFRIDYNRELKTFDFVMYEGVKTKAIFRSEYNNTLNEDYFYYTSKHKTTCLLDYKDAITLFGNEVTGLNRREVYVKGIDKSPISAIEQGRNAVERFPILESFDVGINEKSMQYVYKKDWNLGDIVRCMNKEWGVDVYKHVNEITEFYDGGKENVSVGLGTPLPNLRDKFV